MVQAETSSHSGSGTSSGFLEKLRMKSAAFDGLSAGGEDEAGIVLHGLEPVFHVGKVVAQIIGGGNAKLPADVARADLCHEFAEVVRVVFLLAGPVQAGLVLAPVRIARGRACRRIRPGSRRSPWAEPG